MRLRQKITSVLVAFSVIAAFSVSAYAQGDNPLPDEPQNELIEEPKEISRTEISDDTLPVYLSADRVKEDGFIARLKEEEQSLSEIILEKEDGTRGLYIFGSDIKYVADDGNIVDKSNKLVGRDTYFTSESNDIDMRLPVLLESGVTLRHDDVFVTMKPKAKLGSRIAAAGTASGDKVIYKDVFGEKTSVEYTLNYDGIKENIILDEYTGVSSFDFEIITGGLALTDNKGSLSLTDEKGKARAVIGDIMVFSADLKNNTFGSYTVTEKVKNEVYIVTVEVDPVYLASPDTAYPVTVDPTIKSIQETSDGNDVYYNGIVDLQVFKGRDDTGNIETSKGDSAVSRVGYTTWGTCHTLMKFPNLYLHNRGIWSSSQITKAYVELRDVMCQSDHMPIVCSQFTGSSWSESDQKSWNQLNADSYSKSTGPVGVYYGNGNTERNISNSQHWYRWNIKNIVKEWPTNITCMNKGIMFRSYMSDLEDLSSNSRYMKTFGAMQGNASYKPYFCMEYTAPLRTIEDGIYYIRNKSTGKFIDISNDGVQNGTAVIQNGFAGDLSQRFKVQYESDGFYTIRPMHVNNQASVIDLVGSSAANTVGTNAQLYNYNSNFTEQKFLITSDSAGGYTIGSAASHGTKVLAVANSSSSDGANIQLQNKNNSSLIDNWRFEPYYTRGMTYFAITNLSNDDCSVATNIVSDFHTLKYAANYVTLPSVAIVKSYFPKSSAIVFHGHGSAGSIRLDLSSTLGTNTILYSENQTDTLSDIPPNDWQHIKFVFFATCNSATADTVDHRKSMVDAAIDLGADCVIGFNNSVTGAEDFLELMTDFMCTHPNCTIYSAVDHAKQQMKNLANVNNYSDLPIENPANSTNLVVKGNTSISLDMR